MIGIERLVRPGCLLVLIHYSRDHSIFLARHGWRMSPLDACKPLCVYREAMRSHIGISSSEHVTITCRGLSPIGSSTCSGYLNPSPHPQNQACLPEGTRCLARLQGVNYPGIQGGNIQAPVQSDNRNLIILVVPIMDRVRLSGASRFPPRQINTLA